MLCLLLNHCLAKCCQHKKYIVFSRLVTAHCDKELQCITTMKYYKARDRTRVCTVISIHVCPMYAFNLKINTEASSGFSRADGIPFCSAGDGLSDASNWLRLGKDVSHPPFGHIWQHSAAVLASRCPPTYHNIMVSHAIAVKFSKNKVKVALNENKMRKNISLLSWHV